LRASRASPACPARGGLDQLGQQRYPGAGKFIQLSGTLGLRLGQQLAGLAEGAGLHIHLCRGQHAFGVPRWIGGQQHRPLQERRGRGQPAASLRPADCSSSAATSSSGPDTAWARCQALRSGSASGSVTSASAACAARLSAYDADQ
jgi:hypothetical protein